MGLARKSMYLVGFQGRGAGLQWPVEESGCREKQAAQEMGLAKRLKYLVGVQVRGTGLRWSVNESDSWLQGDA